MNTQEKKELEALKKEYGKNKKIPPKYEKPILMALSFFPELKDTHIEFRLKDNYPVPYGTKPSPGSFMKKAARRKYIITLREKAEHPMWLALFKNLPFQAKVGVIGHELCHVIQYNNCSRTELLKTTLNYIKASFQRQIERSADQMAIEHGLGMELYAHAAFIRSIPGYVEKRKEINRNYLKPAEILESLSIPR
jgi:hypothetical protein